MATSKVILITGANSGVGYEAVKVFLRAEKPYHILCAARSIEKATAAVNSITEECSGVKNTMEPLALDVSSDDSIQKAFEAVRAGPGRVDALINNAGATFDIEYLRGHVSLRDCFNRAYDVNVSGAHLTTHTFMPLLLRSADPRLLFVAGLSQITAFDRGQRFPAQPQPAGWPKPTPAFETIGYRCSKVALNMLTLDWAFRLHADGVKVWGVGPGFLATNLGGMPDKAKEMGAAHPRAGGLLYRQVVEGERDHHVGHVINKDGLAEL